jgi:transaldolase
VIDQLESLGISYDEVVSVLEDEGVEKFAASWNELLETVKNQMAAAGGR